MWGFCCIMRADRIITLWPKLEPRLTKLAKALTKYSFLDEQDLVQEGVLAIKRLKSTKKRPHNLTYLIRAANYQMKKYISREVLVAKRIFYVGSADNLDHLRRVY